MLSTYRDNIVKIARDVRVRLRSNEELDKLREQHPTKLVAEIQSRVSGTIREMKLSELNPFEKYELLFGVYEASEGIGGPEVREELIKELNQVLKSDELVKILRIADEDGWATKANVDASLAGLHKYDEANAVAKYKALRQGRTDATVEECASVVSEFAALRENALNK